MTRELTRDEALSITLELWQWLAKTGETSKSSWPGWKEHNLKGCTSDCTLCEYKIQYGQYCSEICPYPIHFGHNCLTDSNYKDTPLTRWFKAETKLSRQYWARQCVKQIKEIING